MFTLDGEFILMYTIFYWSDQTWNEQQLLQEGRKELEKVLQKD